MSIKFISLHETNLYFPTLDILKDLVAFQDESKIFRIENYSKLHTYSRKTLKNITLHLSKKHALLQ